MNAKLPQSCYEKWPDGPESFIKVMRWEGDTKVKPHKHDFIEIAFVASGSCRHIYHGHEDKLIPGDLFIVTPNEEHAYDVTSNMVIYNCLFYPSVLGEDWNVLKSNKSIADLLIVEPFYRSETGHLEIIHFLFSDKQRVEDIFKSMIEELDNSCENFEPILKSYLVILLCYIGRVWNNQFESRNTIYSTKREMLSEAMVYIETNISNQISIDELANKAYLSPNHFRKMFKKATGMSPIDYINGIRISKAKLLLEEDIPISKIAETVGITDQNYFTKLFKAATGFTPTEFKRNSDKTKKG